MTTHGMYKSSEYTSWTAMKERCGNPSHKYFHRYGGRGIYVCDRWVNSFENFVLDMGMKPSKLHTIDRINNDGIYEPLNCRWATRSEQQKDRQCRTFEIDGKNLNVRELSEYLGVSINTIQTRIARNYPLEKIVSGNVSSRTESPAFLSKADVIEIRAIKKQNKRISNREISKKFGVSQSTIGDIIRRDTWRDIK